MVTRSATVLINGIIQNIPSSDTLSPGTSVIFPLGITPTITQPDLTTNSGTAANLTIQAQKATGTTSTGADLILKSGTGTSNDGFVYLTQGSATPIKVGIQNILGEGSKSYVDFGASSGGMAAQNQLISIAYGSGSSIYFITFAGVSHFGVNTNLDVLTIDSNVNFGTSTVQFVSTVTSPAIKQADLTTNSGTGATLTIQAQNETGTTSTGGTILLQSGTGTTAAGNINLSAGSNIIGAWFANSTNSFFTLDSARTGFFLSANTAGQTLNFNSVGSGNAIFLGAPVIVFQDTGLAEGVRITPASTGATSIKFFITVTSAEINFFDLSTNSGTGATLTIQAQNATGTTSIGGALNLVSGTGTSTPGVVNLKSGATTIMSVGGNAPLLWTNTSLSATSGTTTLTAAQQQTPLIVYSASLSGDITIDFGNIAGFWWLDIGNVTLNAHTVSVKSGTDTVAISSLLTTSKDMFTIRTSGSNYIAVD